MTDQTVIKKGETENAAKVNADTIRTALDAAVHADARQADADQTLRGELMTALRNKTGRGQIGKVARDTALAVPYRDKSGEVIEGRPNTNKADNVAWSKLQTAVREAFAALPDKIQTRICEAYGRDLPADKECTGLSIGQVGKGADKTVDVVPAKASRGRNAGGDGLDSDAPGANEREEPGSTRLYELADKVAKMRNRDKRAAAFIDELGAAVGVTLADVVALANGRDYATPGTGAETDAKTG